MESHLHKDMNNIIIVRIVNMLQQQAEQRKDAKQ
jgi:hypothetical protein